MIELINISKSFGKLKVLDNIDINFEQSGIYAVLGPNSSGKTTLIKTILGMVIPDRGDVLYKGKRVNGDFEYRADISYMPQIAHFPENLTGHELISMIKDIRHLEANDENLIDLFGLRGHLNKNLKYLSGGTKQKINAVIALMFDTPLLFLDEPTAGLDPVALIRFKEHIKKLKDEGKTILLTTHIINLVEEIADNIIFLLEGKIYFNGSTANLIKNSGSNTLEEAIAKILQENENV